jgi:hypothetical protein
MLVMDTRFGSNEAVRAQFQRYRNGQICITLVTEEGEPWLDATSAIPFPVPAGCVAVKDWSENDGVPAILLQSGVIEGDPVAHIPSGYVAVPIYRLTVAARQAVEAARS